MSKAKKGTATMSKADMKRITAIAGAYKETQVEKDRASEMLLTATKSQAERIIQACVGWGSVSPEHFDTVLREPLKNQLLAVSTSEASAKARVSTLRACILAATRGWKGTAEDRQSLQRFYKYAVAKLQAEGVITKHANSGEKKPKKGANKRRGVKAGKEYSQADYEALAGFAKHNTDFLGASQLVMADDDRGKRFADAMESTAFMELIEYLTDHHATVTKATVKHVREYIEKQAAAQDKRRRA